MLKVLHIEDDAGNRRLVQRVLNREDFIVAEAPDGVNGVKLALETQPDIILLDIELPDMDGYEVTLKLRGELGERHVPIVALTGKGDRKMIEAVGCDGHIFKPIDVERFPGQVRAFVKAAKPRIERNTHQNLLWAQGHKTAGKLQAKIEELERTNRRLLESEKVRAEFYRNLSHELSTPLTPAVGYLNMLLGEELGAVTPLQKKALEAVERGVTRVRSVVDNLLDMTALSTGKMSFFARYYDFNKLARESIKMCADRFDERGITLETDIGDRPIKAFGDSDKLARAMVQLLENAVKFCRGDGKVRVRTSKLGDRLLFRVYDSGKGIPAAELKAIFNTFYQIDGSPTREHGGAGLGLALARKIVERFGGEIWAESPPKAPGADLLWARTMVGIWIPERMSEKEEEESSEFRD